MVGTDACKDQVPDRPDPWDTPIKNLREADGDPEPACLSSWGEFRYRVWEFYTRWRSVLCSACYPCC